MFHMTHHVGTALSKRILLKQFYHLVVETVLGTCWTERVAKAMWNYRPFEDYHKPQQGLGDHKAYKYNFHHARRDLWGEKPNTLRDNLVVPKTVPKNVRVELPPTRLKKVYFDPRQGVLESDKLLAELGKKCRALGDAIRAKKQQDSSGESTRWLQVRKRQVESRIAARIEMLKEVDHQGLDDNTYFVVYYDDDIADDNTCSAKIEEYFSLRKAQASFEAYVKFWNLIPSFEVDTRGLPEGSICLKAACADQDACDEDTRVVLARAPSAPCGGFSW
jgi:hypothetical protein